MQGATRVYAVPVPSEVFQSTLPMQGATKSARKEGSKRSISIHAPYAGSDHILYNLLHKRLISIHAPYAGSDAIAASSLS